MTYSKWHSGAGNYRISSNPGSPGCCGDEPLCEHTGYTEDPSEELCMECGSPNCEDRVE